MSYEKGGTEYKGSHAVCTRLLRKQREMIGQRQRGWQFGSLEQRVSVGPCFRRAQPGGQPDTQLSGGPKFP